MTMQKRKKNTPAPSKNGAKATVLESDVPRIRPISVKKALEIAEMDSASERVMRLSVLIDKDMATQEHVEEWLELSGTVQRKTTIEQRCKIFADYVEYVPHDWFADEMPSEIDFSDPETYLSLPSDRFGELFGILSFGSALQRENVSGN